ncbi:MAG: hypothetical protein JW821_16275, partial [Deltaproteobacteria bacterium]|nr:hypothetical protein [Deltaproteobacteria bacterium]
MPTSRNDRSINPSPSATSDPQPPREDPALVEFRVEDADREWHKAKDRVLLYLRALKASARMEVALALETLEMAMQEDRGLEEPFDPVPRAMRLLRRLLADRGYFSSEAPPFGDWAEYAPSGQYPGDPGHTPESLTSMPPLNRCSMVPERMD